MTVLYFDCVSGASGDMIIAALVDAGAPMAEVRSAIERLPIEGVSVRHEPTTRRGVRASAIEIVAPDEASSRTYRDIRSMLETTELPSGVRDIALRTFQLLAEAEGRVHNIPVDDVHFHEVGALDTIADVVGAATALEHFSPTSVVTSSIPLGSGWVDAAHGRLPVPAPAVTEILRDVPVRAGGEGEVITPTGAAFLKAVSDRFGDLPPMFLRATGYGAGSKDLEAPNVLRVMVGEEITTESSGHVLLETNIDDMSPELIPYVVETLIRAGAQDAWTTPIVMKKGRPAVTLSVLVDAASKDRAMDVLYRETTTLGVRIRTIEKDELTRAWVEVEIDGHPMRVKIARRGGEAITIAPEYEDAAKVARATGLPLKEVYERAKEKARSLRL